VTATPSRSRRGSLQRQARPTITRSSGRPVVRAAIAGVGSYIPEQVVTSEEVERRIAEASTAHGFVPRRGIVEQLTGVRERRYSADHEQASDLAVAAARQAIEQAGIDVADIELIVFGSSSQDMVEPATGHIVSHKLGAKATVFDVKNACNSFLNGMQVADALIRSGQYRRVLVCTGEKPSIAVRWELRDWDHMKSAFAGYTFGDAGAAVVLEARSDGTGIQAMDMVAASHNWEICTLEAGGTMHPRDHDKTFFSGDGNSLRDAFIELGPDVLIDLFKRTKTSFDDYDVILFHQVTEPFLDVFLQVSGVPEERIVRTVDLLGNVASASLPLQLERAVADGRVKRGSRVLWVGLGAGISVGVMTMRI
jgi:3-oxoacyl-[acyl-carrier-protein] synthase-3